MFKSKLHAIISNLPLIFAIVLLIIRLTTDIHLNSDLIFISNAIIFSLIGFQEIKSRKLLGYICFIPAIIMIISGIYSIIN